MISLAEECLLFELGSGECVPYSAEMVSVEMRGSATEVFDPEFVQHAAKAVFHYFKHEQGRQTVTVGEFAGALQKVLRGFATMARLPAPADPRPTVLEYDLRRLALETGQGCELFFFPRLRAELQRHLQQASRVVRFRGLRGCVKHLTGARRWSRRCETLEREIVDYLRRCLSAECGPIEFSLVVE